MRRLPGWMLVGLVAGFSLGGCGGVSSTATVRSHSRSPRSIGTRPGDVKKTGSGGSSEGGQSGEVRNARPQSSWRPYAGQKVPILVYHDLGTPPPTEDYPGLYVSYADFSAEMAWLHSSGYQAVTLDEMMDAFHHHGTLPAKPIVITFDNGYVPQATFAPAVLARYGWPGVLNEITENHLENFRLFRLIRLGWEIDSHSTTHTIDLTQATPAELHQQVFASRSFLRRVIHVPANSFCYPSNYYNAAVIAAVKAAGYTNATTEDPGFATPATNPYLLPRFEIEGGVSELRADLATGT